MHAVVVPAMSDRVQFGAAVRSRSWDWLFALRKRLNVELQLVDDGLSPLLTASGGGVDVPLSGEASGLRLAISTAIRTRTPQPAAVGRAQTVLVPVTIDRGTCGAHDEARRATTAPTDERMR